MRLRRLWWGFAVLIVCTLVSTPIVHADVDDDFVVALHAAGFTATGDAPAAARAACALLREGAAREESSALVVVEVVTALSVANPELSWDDALRFLVLSARWFCPEFL